MEQEKYPHQFIRAVVLEFGFNSPTHQAVLDDQGFAGHHLDEVEVGCRLRLAAENAHAWSKALAVGWGSRMTTREWSQAISDGTASGVIATMCLRRRTSRECDCLGIYNEWLRLRDAQRKAAAA